jgi:hypothetical protein
LRLRGFDMPLTEADIDDIFDDIFSYHAPDDRQLECYEAIRIAGREFAEAIIRNTPASADQSAAIRKAREAVMTANAAIALKGRY